MDIPDPFAQANEALSIVPKEPQHIEVIVEDAREREEDREK